MAEPTASWYNLAIALTGTNCNPAGFKSLVWHKKVFSNI